VNQISAPKSVVRFYGNPDYALETIALQQITFVHVDKLNDPFDPILDFATDFNDDYACLLAHVQKHHSSEFEFFKNKFPEEAWKMLVEAWSKLASDTRQEMLVFSSCAVTEENHPRDNLYMWGHYGNGHRGVAIEFDAIVLGEPFERPDSKFPWWKMEYKQQVPKITCEYIVELILNLPSKANPEDLSLYGAKLKSLMSQRINSKAEVWKHENEWRLVWLHHKTTLKIHRHDFPQKAIKAIYLGCRATEHEVIARNFVLETQKRFPNVTVFRANMREGEYALDFQKII
jgi:hypothetical protein